MHFLSIQLFLIIFYQKVFASIYDTPCITTCNSPGLICVNGRCKCDSKNRLFWTGARCLSCPVSWAMSETKCIGYYGTKMSWPNAEATCQQMQGDLLSLRDNDIIPLIYQITGDSNRYKKREIAADKTVAWTSAHVVEHTDLSLYEWNDYSLPKFNSTHTWWCRIGITGLGFYYPYQEPTRLVYKTDVEKCVLFRRGITSASMVCLDDEFCYHEYPFVCERSEATAQKYFGPAVSDGGSKPGGGNVGSATTTRSYSSRAGSYVKVTDPAVNNDPLVPMLPVPNALESKKNNKSIIILVILGLLLLAGILTGIFFFIRHRKTTGTQFQVGDNNKKQKQAPTNVRPPIKEVPIVSGINDIDELPTQPTSTDEPGLTLGTGLSPGNIDFNIGNQKQQKNKRGGYSKQQFDEFE